MEQPLTAPRRRWLSVRESAQEQYAWKDMRREDRQCVLDASQISSVLNI